MLNETGSWRRHENGGRLSAAGRVRNGPIGPLSVVADTSKHYVVRADYPERADLNVGRFTTDWIVLGGHSSLGIGSGNRKTAVAYSAVSGGPTKRIPYCSAIRFRASSD